ncbi:hypothetical protein MDAP_000235 [Mitosporidium daphniae]|uniref:30S ribosomal protein S19 n=1 Tax=Mitosporidium daphniae TaxID=1485682 RepID=A0A098VVR9_9MICR|nr:30S ribosomal protein S19 [Mitosporidium daphniae]KGG51816.1 30S ribosomal protein S19 [Mitosporidium daphniae]|eukprot:XP_013238243.1 30S ribosomal protein S19 [Mitosporidium daphniae]
MPRALWKGPYFDLRLFKAIQEDAATKKGVITYARSSTVIPAFVGAKLLVHTGRSFTPLVVREEMVGRKLGALVPTITRGEPPKSKAQINREAAQAAAARRRAAAQGSANK